jgi:hypothetical protein
MEGMTRVGCPDLDAPDYLTKNRGLLSLLTDPRTGRPYDDNLCFFRCLAIALSCRCPGERCACRRVPERATRSLLNDYLSSLRDNDDDDDDDGDASTFAGVDEDDLLRMERLFQTSITVYHLLPDRSARVEWCSHRSYPRQLNLNLWESHFS